MQGEISTDRLISGRFPTPHQSDGNGPGYEVKTQMKIGEWGNRGPNKKLANIKNTIILFVCPFNILHKHCFYFLLGIVMVPRQTGNNAWAKFGVAAKTRGRGRGRDAFFFSHSFLLQFLSLFSCTVVFE